MLAKVFPSGRYDEPVPTVFYLFASPPHGDAYDLAGGVGTVGFFQPTPVGNYAALLRGEGETALRSLLKQYLHSVIRLNLPAAPDWLRHGMAEFYSTFEADEEGASYGLPITGHLQWLRQLSGGARLPLETVLTSGPPSDQRGRGAYTAQSWLLVHHLLARSEDGGRRVASYIRALEAGADSLAAFRTHVAGDLENLTATLELSLSSGSWPYLRVPGVVEANDTTLVRVLPAADAHAHLGELVLHTQTTNPELARAHVEASLASQPQNVRALVGVGVLASRAGAHDEAVTALDRAAAASPDDPIIGHLHAEAILASLEGRRPEGEGQLSRLEQAIEVLQRSAGARPGFAEGWVRLGYAHGLHPNGAAKAGEALEKAFALLPTRTDIALNLLLAYAGSGRREDAEDTAVRLAALGADESQLRRARHVLLQLEYREAVALMHENRLEESMTRLLRILDETQDPALIQAASGLLESIEPVAPHNDFAARYLVALGQFRSGSFAEARVTAIGLRTSARREKQAEAVDALLAAIDRRGMEEGAE